MNILMVSSCVNIASAYSKFLLDHEEVEDVFATQSIVECIHIMKSSAIDLTVLSVEILPHLEEIERIFDRAGVPGPKRVLMVPHVSGRIVVEAIAKGVNDVVGLDLPADQILSRFRSVVSGETDISKKSFVQGIRDLVGEDNKARFAHDEVDLRILLQLAYGHSNREISEAVYLSLQTVRNRISRLMHVMKAQNRTQLALMFLQD